MVAAPKKPKLKMKKPKKTTSNVALYYTATNFPLFITSSLLIQSYAGFDFSSIERPQHALRNAVYRVLKFLLVPEIWPCKKRPKSSLLLLLLLLTKLSPDFWHTSSTLILFKFGMLIPCNIPPGRFSPFFEFPPPSLKDLIFFTKNFPRFLNHFQCFDLVQTWYA